MPELETVAPIAKDGSTPQCCNATVNMEVVVVFPCVPATATERFCDINIANASARSKIGIFNSFARFSSTFDAEIALEITIISRPAILSAECDAKTTTPNLRSPSSVCESFISEPDTFISSATKIRAIPLIPDPPIPMK
ncbi:unannotated protein [freshwater metagenome]|uniref:Unannotated protein n=1 Tax=freshwater metagenome TaxID=449393 RepID=A0A6J7JTP1_9ZZZZ